jgi:hypothetical protein
MLRRGGLVQRRFAEPISDINVCSSSPLWMVSWFKRIGSMPGDRLWGFKTVCCWCWCLSSSSSCGLTLKAVKMLNVTWLDFNLGPSILKRYHWSWNARTTAKSGAPLIGGKGFKSLRTDLDYLNPGPWTRIQITSISWLNGSLIH